MLTKDEQAEIFKRVKALCRLHVRRYKYNIEQKRHGAPTFNHRSVQKEEAAFKDFLKEVG